MAEPHRPPPEDRPSGPPPGFEEAFRGSQNAGEPPREGAPGIDLEALLTLLDTVRRAAPAELQDRLNTLLRELLLTTRALIDWYLERLDEPQPDRAHVESIPID